MAVSVFNPANAAEFALGSGMERSGDILRFSKQWDALLYSDCESLSSIPYCYDGNTDIINNSGVSLDGSTKKYGSYSYAFSGTDNIYIPNNTFRFLEAGVLEVYYIPGYSGTPASDGWMLHSASSIFELRHRSTGALQFVMRDSVYSPQCNINGAWSPTSGTSYLIAIQWDRSEGTKGTVSMFIDGVIFGTPDTDISNCVFGSCIQTLRHGSGLAGPDFNIDDVAIYDSVQYDWAGFTPRTTAKGVVYSTSQPVSYIRWDAGSNSTTWAVSAAVAGILDPDAKFEWKFAASDTAYSATADQANIDTLIANEGDAWTPTASLSGISDKTGRYLYATVRVTSSASTGYAQANLYLPTPIGNMTVPGPTDYPSEDDVRKDTSFAFGLSIGNLELPSTPQVGNNVGYGSNGTEYYGTAEFFPTPSESFSTMVDAVAYYLEIVPGIGKVHKRRRHTKFWDEYYSRHIKDGRVNNWEITRESVTDDLSNAQNASGYEPYFHKAHMIKIFGHMSLDDSKDTETTFQLLIDQIDLIFRTNNTLNGTVLLPRQIQAPLIGHQTYGGVLCHFCELTYEAIERVSD